MQLDSPISALISLPYFDKAGHFIVYAVLAWVASRIFRGQIIPVRGCRVPLALVLVGGLALIDEATQTIAPGREAEILDLLCDLAGAVLAVGIYKNWGGRFSRKARKPS